jgi:hypothetical protein
MNDVRLKHPTITINNAKQRFLDNIRNSKIYEIVKYNVFMCDDIYQAEKYSLEEIKEAGIELSEDFDLSIYIDVAKYDTSKESLLKTLDRKALTEEENAEISMLNTLYPLSVTIKGVLLDKFKLD